MVDPEQPRFLSLLRDAWLLSPTCWDGLRPLSSLMVTAFFFSNSGQCMPPISGKVGMLYLRLSIFNV